MSRPQCRDLYKNYKKACNDAEAAFWNWTDVGFIPCKEIKFENATLEELRKYIVGTNEMVKVYENCARKRIEHTNRCYKGVSDTGHETALRTVQNRGNYCRKLSDQALNEYQGRFLSAYSELGNFTLQDDLIKSLKITLHVRQIIKWDHDIDIEGLSFEQINSALDAMDRYGEDWIIKV